MTDIFRIEPAAGGARTAVLRLHGQLDARSAPEVLAAGAAAARERRHLVLNLSGVSFIASSGVGALLALVEGAQQAGLQVRLAEVSPSVDSVLKLLNLDQLLALDSNEQAAIAEAEAA